VIAVNQDSLGVQGAPVWSNCDPNFKRAVNATTGESVGDPPECQQIWAKPLHSGAQAVVFVNFADTAVNVTCDATAGCMAALGMQVASVRDLWAHKVRRERCAVRAVRKSRTCKLQ
jgi:hypothetical protein